MIDFEEKVALVTGGSQGLGRAIAIELARLGATVVIGDINNFSIQDIADESVVLEKKAITLPLDVTDTDSINNCIQQVVARFSHIDILVNNAGVGQKNSGPETTLVDFDNSYNVNVKGIWSMTNALRPYFQKNGSGKIINIASVAGRGGSTLMPAYNASKAAVINLTQSLAKLLGPDNVNVNAVCPGLTRTSMVNEILEREGKKSVHTDSSFSEESFIQGIIDSSALRRMITPEDVAHAVAFLASEQAKNITGQSLNVDCGGMMD